MNDVHQFKCCEHAGRMFLLFVLSVVLLLWWRYKPGGLYPPVYPGALPLIGHVGLLIGDAAVFMKNFIDVFSFCNKNDGLIYCYVGTHTVYVVTDPDDSVTVSNTCLKRPYMYDFLESVKQGLLGGEVEQWKHQRKLLNPAFNHETLQTYMKVFNQQARELVSELRLQVEKPPFDAEPYFTTLSLEVTCQTSLGLPPGHGKVDKEYCHAVTKVAGLLVKRITHLWLHPKFIYNMSSLKKTLDGMRKIIKNTSNSVIQERKKQFRDIANNNQSSDKFKPFLDQLLLLNAEKDVFTESEISDHVDTMIAAGFDTTATALTFIFIMIGSHPDIQEHIYKELCEILEDRDVTGSDLPKLVYLEAVVKESLRLYPPAPMIARKIDQDVKLRNFTLKAGSTCIIGIYGNNRHNIWGEDAHEFRPERWLTPDTLPINPNAFASFGFGRRNCIGKHYALMIIKTTLAHVLRRYRIITSNDSKLELKFHILLKPTSGHHISLELRK